ncbi:WW domain-binding protein 2-like [Babesia duncani]|uniref:WW domain-binding protein 2-like n=1 Tax=Babesia duncani TaxID=323732 RepID=A0AAD9PHA8_9APIC|nr:WW domain-binding protein 2-like [Babesia duncani]
MALNPVLARDVNSKNLLPYCALGESLLMTRGNVTVTVKLENRRLEGKGSLFLTTHRIVVIKDLNKQFEVDFSSIELPLRLIEEPRFHQPIFRSNHFDGVIYPVLGAPNPLESKGQFTLTFAAGRCNLFLKGFYIYYARVRQDPRFMAPHDPFSDIPDGRNAFYDPSDPSRIYFSQPDTEPLPSECAPSAPLQAFVREEASQPHPSTQPLSAITTLPLLR